MAVVSLPLGATNAPERYNRTAQKTSAIQSPQGMRMHEPRVPGRSEEERRQYQLKDWCTLAAQCGEGDELALDVLRERYAKMLYRWARNHMSWNGFDRSNKELDLLKEIVLSASLDILNHLNESGIKHEGALLLGLRDAVHHKLQSSNKNAEGLEKTIGTHRAQSYERSLARLQPMEREALICALEFQRSFSQLKEDLALASVETARDVYARAVVRLAEEMCHGR